MRWIVGSTLRRIHCRITFVIFHISLIIKSLKRAKWQPHIFIYISTNKQNLGTKISFICVRTTGLFDRICCRFEILVSQQRLMFVYCRIVLCFDKGNKLNEPSLQETFSPEYNNRIVPSLFVFQAIRFCKLFLKCSLIHLRLVVRPLIQMPQNDKKRVRPDERKNKHIKAVPVSNRPVVYPTILQP